MNDEKESQEHAVTYFDNQTGRKVEFPCKTLDNVLRILRTLAMKQKEAPFTGAYIGDAQGNTLAVGLADRGWLLMFGDAQRTHTAFSVGHPNDAGKLSFLFYQREELPKRYLLNVERAVDVIRNWFETGDLSTSIEWFVEEF